MASFSLVQLREHGVALLDEVGQLRVERFEAIATRDVGLLGERDALDLELAHAPLDHVDLRGERVDLDAQLGRRLVHQVDGLVGQEAAGEVPIGEHRRRDEGRVLDPHPVVDLVALA